MTYYLNISIVSCSNLNLAPSFFRESETLTGKWKVLFHLVTFSLTFEASINFRLSYFMLSSPSSFFIFSWHISFFISHHSFFDPTLLFDALSIEIPPECLLHLYSSYFCHLYELLLRLFRHFFFLTKHFFIFKLIIFFYM